MNELEFLKLYESTTNTHNFENVKPLIDPNATYFFSDSTLVGIDEIENAFKKTWNNIQNEIYVIKHVKWLVADLDVAVCSYEFEWSGIIDGAKSNGGGRGTNVMCRIDSSWKMIHEHLSNHPTIRSS